MEYLFSWIIYHTNEILQHFLLYLVHDFVDKIRHKYNKMNTEMSIGNNDMSIIYLELSPRLKIKTWLRKYRRIYSLVKELNYLVQWTLFATVCSLFLKIIEDFAYTISSNENNNLTKMTMYILENNVSLVSLPYYHIIFC